jgi:hypothetical protein
MKSSDGKEVTSWSTNKIHVVKNHIKNKIKPLHQEIRNGRKLKKIKKQKKHLP